MPQRKEPTTDDQNDRLQKSKLIGRYLLALRRSQNKADAEFLASLGTLNSQQLNVLNIIGDAQRCPISVVSYITSMPLSSITFLIDKLVRKKLVKRERSESDQRVFYVELTPAGLEIYNKQINQLELWAATVLATLTSAEQDVLVKFMQRFADTFR